MPLSKEAREWAGIGPLLKTEKIPPPVTKTREYIVGMRRHGKSLVLTIPAPVRKALSLYEGAPMRLVIAGKTVQLTRVDTTTTSQIDILKANYPQAKVPWAKKIHLFGPHLNQEQYELQGLPLKLIARLSRGGKGRENSS